VLLSDNDITSRMFYTKYTIGYRTVGIATDYGLDDREVGVRVQGRAKNFLFSTSCGPALRPNQPPIQWILGVKRPGREADHSPTASAELKKMWIYTPIPHTPSWNSAVVPKLCAAAPRRPGEAWPLHRGVAKYCKSFIINWNSLIPRFDKMCSDLQDHPSH
jgi:hypothetical protein